MVLHRRRRCRVMALHSRSDELRLNIWIHTKIRIRTSYINLNAKTRKTKSFKSATGQCRHGTDHTNSCKFSQTKRCIISHGLSFELMGKQTNTDVMWGWGWEQRKKSIVLLLSSGWGTVYRCGQQIFSGKTGHKTVPHFPAMSSADVPHS